MQLFKRHKLLFTLLTLITGTILFFCYKDVFSSWGGKSNQGEVVEKSSTFTVTEPLLESEQDRRSEKNKPGQILYRVESGDTLSGIAEKNGIDVETILGANSNVNSDRLDVGQELVILPVKGVLHRVEPGETVEAIALRYGVMIESILEANTNVDPLRLQIGQSLIIPGAKPASPVREVSVTSRSGTGRKFIPPVQVLLTDGFGQRINPVNGSRDFHEGWDLAAPEGAPIKAVGDGEVIFAGWDGGYGLAVKINHGKGITTLYAHTSALLVSPGDRVFQGTIIAKVGNTGISTGSHLHFEVRKNESPVDPGLFF